MDNLGFLSYKDKLQNLYNSKATEEKEIIYACLIFKNPLQDDDQNQKDEIISINTPSNKNINNLNPYASSNNSLLMRGSTLKKDFFVLLTKLREEFFIEIVTSIMSSMSINFNYSLSLEYITQIQCKQNSSEVLVFSESRDFSIQILPPPSSVGKNVNYLEFIWCLIHLIERKKELSNSN